MVYKNKSDSDLLCDEFNLYPFEVKNSLHTQHEILILNDYQIALG